MFKASLETPRFNFEAYGSTEREAMDFMRLAWGKHRRQYGPGVARFAEYEEDVQVMEIQLGGMYRDGEALR